jgi:hypothetical protein
MLRTVLRTVATRLAVGGLVLGLSGAAGLLPPAEAPAHRCRCTHGAAEPDCACPACHAAARARSAAARTDGKPPCLRCLDGRPPGSARRQAGPCLLGTCGDEQARLLPNDPLQRFTVAERPRLEEPPVADRTEPPDACPQGERSEPETPPPRAG